jgi:hypothetical protein
MECYALKKFQRVMDDTLKTYFDWLIVYIDDALVLSDSIDQHFKHLMMFLKVIKLSGLVLSKNKMDLFKTSVKFLGHTISNGQISL